MWRRPTARSGVEAALDIQFLMGVAPGVKTEFWEWAPSDFCADLHNYTETLLADDAVPISNSISYGWQGNLSALHCVAAQVDVIDTNWAKLAAKGISIMISSGDSGSGYTSDACKPAVWLHDTAITGGTLLRTDKATAGACCSMHQDAVGWTWTPPPKPMDASAPALARGERPMRAIDRTAPRAADAPGAGPAGRSAATHSTAPLLAPPSPPRPTVFNASAPWHVELVFGPDHPWRHVFIERDLWSLSGTLPGSAGGTLKLHNRNGTFADTTLQLSAPFRVAGRALLYRNATVAFDAAAAALHQAGNGTLRVTGKLECIELADGEFLCYQLQLGDMDNPATGVALVNHGPNPPPPPPLGTCKLYSAVTATGNASGAISSGSGINPIPFQLWPSWPASSPWVTAVGATRFIGQRVGGGEMASDQFGSGGGFSSQFDQTHAQWQAKAVASYVAQGASLPRFPPASAFPALGRATPDVSALGEGYQVYEGGKVQSVGGTSASAPMFAGLVSLLNDARLKAGKPRMGFLNPFLYAHPDAFHDIVNGTNAHPRGEGMVPYGYACAKGWDPATGLGTPRFRELLAAALAAA